MRRIAAILMTLLFLFNTMGYYFVFSYSRCLFRNEMKQCIRAGDFEKSSIILKIKDPSRCADFERLGKDEFRYMNDLYDIVSEFRSGDTTIFICINDNKEEQLLAGFHNFIESTTFQNNPAKARHAIAMNYHLVRIALLTETGRTHPSQTPITLAFNNTIYSLSSILYPPPYPPPKQS
jgi:hypothetical protein